MVLDSPEIASGIGDDLLQQAACVLQPVENAREFAAQAVVGADERRDGTRRALVDCGAHGLGRLRIHEVSSFVFSWSEASMAWLRSSKRLSTDELRSCRASTT